MANLPEVSEFTAGVYQWEVTDPAEAGPDGIMNVPLKALANRTKWLKDNALKYMPRELKWIAGVNQTFINDNFPGGAGVAGIYAGWFVANGANGTDDMGGKVAIGQGNGYAVGASGGSKDAVVVAHTHATVADYANAENLPGTALTANNAVAKVKQNDGDLKYNLVPALSGTVATVGKSGETGVSGADKNMQPYRVVLCIQFLGT